MLIKKLAFLIISLFSAGSFAWTFNGDGPDDIKIGDAIVAADVKMKSVAGNDISFKDLKRKNGLVVIFSCNTCPFVVGRGESEGWEGRYNALAKIAFASEIGMVLVNSNTAKRDGDDSLEKMIAHAKAESYQMAYAVDKNSEIANKFGAKTTPHVYLFNAESKLVYRGAIDDNNDSAKKVKEHYLKNALAEMIAGKEISVSESRPLGCSIKRK
jgi:hypothetical protein